MPPPTPPKTITYDTYLKALGVTLLIRDHVRGVKSLESILASLLQEPDDGGGYYGAVSDAIYDDPNVDQLIKDLDIRVAG